MIAFLEGTVLTVEEGSLVIMQGGIGLRVYTVPGLLHQTYAGQKVALYTHLIVREDLLALYGFERVDERDLFTQLLGVNGVGPRLALAILGTLSTDMIKRAVLSEQSDVFGRVPGVGKTTAQKILLYLKGKIKGDLETMGGAILDVDTEILEALTSLGYSVIEAQSVIQALPKDAPKDVESRLRMALQYFQKP
jgi:Holliday junction DNA helicase RuvA